MESMHPAMCFFPGNEVLETAEDSEAHSGMDGATMATTNQQSQGRLQSIGCLPCLGKHAMKHSSLQSCFARPKTATAANFQPGKVLSRTILKHKVESHPTTHL